MPILQYTILNPLETIAAANARNQTTRAAADGRCVSSVPACVLCVKSQYLQFHHVVQALTFTIRHQLIYVAVQTLKAFAVGNQRVQFP